MTKMADTKESPFLPGKKFPLLGVSLQTTIPWIRWGLPIATGLVVDIIVWLLI